ncbi:MAG: hypothetical protein HQK78_13300, partial [Desulfobacterales bacterium]|nr:hypothetical protein [Desulfobacterales bacterium]
GAGQIAKSFNITVRSIADPPVLNVNPSTSGYDAVPLALIIEPPALSDTDGSEKLGDITISGVPDKAILSSGINKGNGVWTLSAGELSDLTLTYPAVAEFVLTVSVNSVEADNGNTAASSKTINVKVDSAKNDIVAANIKAEWNKGISHLTWDKTEGIISYQIYRGTSESDISIISETFDPFFIDPSPQYFYTWYYRIATVKEYTVPITNHTFKRIGPLSNIVCLKALPIPKISITGSKLLPDGAYSIIVGQKPPYEVKGTYEIMSGDVKVIARRLDKENLGTGTNSSFDIKLETSGEWDITVSEQNGWMKANVRLKLEIDAKPPTLTLEGSETPATEQNFILIKGKAEDSETGIKEVKISSEKYNGQFFKALVDSSGYFSVEIPLQIGENRLSVIASDNVGNETIKSLLVTAKMPTLPDIIISNPIDGTSVSIDKISVSGVVRSALSPDKIRLVLSDRVQFPEGINGEYTFIFKDVHLTEGSNILEVKAETPYGVTSAKSIVTYKTKETNEEKETSLPEIEIQSLKPDSYISGDNVTVSGTVKSESGIKSILVNGSEAEFIAGEDGSISFKADLSFLDKDSLNISVEAIDLNGKKVPIGFVINRDNKPPIIELTSNLKTSPEINNITETPYTLSGKVIEKNLSGLSINNQNIGVTPSGTDTWSFNGNIDLIRGKETPIIIDAWDYAGNKTSKEIILKFDSNIDIEVISPMDGGKFTASEESTDIDITVRALGITQEDSLKVYIDTSEVSINRTGNVANGKIKVSEGEHKLIAEVKTASGNLLSRRNSYFSVINSKKIPLELERQDPENNSKGVEPNAYIAFYFNKPIEPSLLEIKVTETVHGKTYVQPQPGADITQQSKVQTTEINRDNEAVTGSISYFPSNTMAAFYPERDFGYNGNVFVTVLYSGSEIYRSTFTIRPSPTLIYGFVYDTFFRPLTGIEVESPMLGRKSVTDNNGCYSFGFGESAVKNNINAGRYQAVINPNLKNRLFGSVAIWMNVQPEQLNNIGFAAIPILNPQNPFRRIVSGQDQMLVGKEGEIVLNLKEVQLTFPDGKDRGDVYAQYFKREQISHVFSQSVTVIGAFSIQPIGVEVSGNLQMTILLSPINGSYDYVSKIGSRVALIGINPDTLEIIPVGVGKVNEENKKIISEGKTTYKRLDFIGYAFVKEENQPLLERYVKGEISLKDMVTALETTN